LIVREAGVDEDGERGERADVQGQDLGALGTCGEVGGPANEFEQEYRPADGVSQHGRGWVRPLCDWEHECGDAGSQ